jgi:calcium-dependent protein kinase
MLYILLCGLAPYGLEADDIGDTERRVVKDLIIGTNLPLKAHLQQSKRWTHISQQAKDVVLAMLTAAPSKRKKASELMRMPWFDSIGGHQS